MSEVVLDSCVWIDMMVKDRQRNAAAISLGHKLQRDAATVLVPMHAFFEIMTAVASESRKDGKALKPGEFDETFPFAQKYIPIDNDFLGKYLFNLPPQASHLNFGAGDMIFLAVALKHRCPLVTEDQKFLKRASAIGITALDVARYMKT